MGKYKAVLFDFDGVILDTVQLKIDGFVHVYRDEVYEKQDAVRSYAQANGGHSRYQKFIYFETSIFNRKADASDIDLLCRRYGAFVDKGIAIADFILGAPTCFAGIKDLQVTQHIISAAPHNDLLDVLATRNIDHYFKSVSGAPTEKIVEFRKILAEEQLDPHEALAIGDSLAEHDAAVALGVPFVAIVAKGALDPFPDNVTKCPDLREIVRFFAE